MTAVVRKARLALVEEMPPGGLTLGWLVEIDPDGRAVVDYAGNARGPLLARSALRLTEDSLAFRDGRVDLLLAFVAGESAPVIVGLVGAQLLTSSGAQAAAEPMIAKVDGREVRIEAAERIEIRCGRGSITLTADGRVAIKGRELVSRAEQSNKVRGASVLIN